MAERTIITELVSLAPEASYGVAVATTKKLQTMSIMLAPELETTRIRANGYKPATVIAPNREWTSGDVEGYPTYNEIVYPLSSLLKKVTATGAGANKTWLFEPSSTSVETVESFTVEQGDAASRAHKASGVLFTSFGLEIPRNGDPSISGTVMGQRIVDGITPTGGTTEIAVQPLLNTEVDVYLDATAAALGTTKLLRVVNVGFEISDMWGPLWALNSANLSFVAPVQTEPSMSATLTVEADSAGMALLTQMRAGSTQFLRIKATGPALGSGTYLFQSDFAVKVNGAPSFGDEDGVRTAEWSLEIVHDSTWSKHMSITVVNAIAAL